MEPALAARLEEQAGRLRAEGGLGRSDALTRLFDFLVAQTLAGRSPKEVEIAEDVFDKRASVDVVADATVRVYVHRLRRKIDDFYLAHPDGERLYLPKGEYRLALAANVPGATDGAARPAALPARGGARVGWRTVAMGAALLFAVNLALWLVLADRPKSDGAARAAASAFWKPLATNGRPTMIASGNYYLFAEAPGTSEVRRLIRHAAVNSKSDLDRYLLAHPEHIGRYADAGVQFLPASIAPALRDLLPVVGRATGGGVGTELMIPISGMTPDMLKKANIVYIGDLSSLGLLRDPVFAASSFQLAAKAGTLIDIETRERDAGGTDTASDSGPPRRDFAYLASLPGPSGTRVLIVAGSRDAAIMQAAEIASDPRQLDRIAAGVGDAAAFEALYQVQTLDNLNLGSRLLGTRGFRPDRIWSPDRIARGWHVRSQGAQEALHPRD